MACQVGSNVLNRTRASVEVVPELAPADERCLREHFPNDLVDMLSIREHGVQPCRIGFQYDLSRIAEPSEKDFARLERYKAAMSLLLI
jgi:hypothetical protein